VTAAESSNSNKPTNKRATQPSFILYRNKKSKMDEAILIQIHPEQHAVSLHAFAIILPGTRPIINHGSVIDTRIQKLNQQKSPFKLLGRIRGGSLVFNRFFFPNPSEKKYEKKLQEKFPNKKIKRKRYFHPIVLLTAHFCKYYPLPAEVNFSAPLEDKILGIAMAFDELISIEIYPTLKAVGKPLYLRGEKSLIDFHLTKMLPQPLLKKMLEDNFLEPINRQKALSFLVPPVEGMRREQADQLPLLQSFPNPQAIAHVIDYKNKMLPLTTEHFPLVVVGELPARQSFIINLLKTLNGRFIIFDPKDEYGRLVQTNPRIRGYRLGENFFLNIISTEGNKIREQVYAYWFAKIIAHATNLKPELTKTIETYLLGAFRNPSNQSRVDLQFRDFANQELTSEVTKMGRSESITISNVLYPLGTYDEISLLTRVGRSYAFDSLFDTKGAVIQFSKEDAQLTKIAYLFTLLKMRAITSEEPKVLVIENLDEILGTTSYKQEGDLAALLLDLAEKFHLILGVRSPSKIKALFQSTKAKFINRLLLPNDSKLLTMEYNLLSKDFSNLSLFSDNEYLYFMPEFGRALYLKLDPLRETYQMTIAIDPLEKESSNRIVHAQDFLEREGIAPEIRGAIFELLRLLREKPSKSFPEEGLEGLFPNYSKEDVLRAKEIARQEAYLKTFVSSPEDSSERITLIQLTEVGEEFYQGYLNLTSKIPKLTIENLALEKSFEKKIFSKLNKVDRQLELGDFISATNGMIDIVLQLLGTFPEDERFMKDKPAAKLIELWSYLSSLIKFDQHSKAKRLYQEFAQTVANSLKVLKHRLLQFEGSTQQNPPQASPPTATPAKKLLVTEGKADDEHQMDFSVTKMSAGESTSARSSTTNASPSNTHTSEINEEDEDEDVFSAKSTSNTTVFHAATADLRTAGVSHRGQHGIAYKPPGGKGIFDDVFKEEKDLDAMLEQPLSSTDPADDLQLLLKDQKERLLALKERVLDRVLQELKAKNSEKNRAFIWNCLVSRFKGKVNNGYTISEIVSLIKRSLEKITSKKQVSEQHISRIELLCEKPNLLSPALLANLTDYLKTAE